MLSLLKRLISLALFAGIALTVYGYWEATRDPVLRETSVHIPTWPAGEPPLRILLLTDLHVAGPDMPHSRVQRIVEQANALNPDLILMAGDFIGDRQVSTRYYPAAEALPPLAGLRARLGTIAVLGNHDHWNDPAAVRAALERAGIRVVVNDAVRVGPLALGGLDDDYTHHDDMRATVARMRAVGGVPILLSHGPDPFPRMPADVPLMFAGHTHCGQIVLPWIGALASASQFDDRYRCGRIDENGRSLIVSAGLGASVLPLRIGAPPDMWMVTVGR